MGDMAEMFAGHREFRKRLRAKFGRPCPDCVSKLPKAHPSILLPRQTCKIHKYKDPRPQLSEADYASL